MVWVMQVLEVLHLSRILEDVLSHQMKQFVIDANKVVLNVSNPDTRVDDVEFGENEFYAIDIVAGTEAKEPAITKLSKEN